MSEFNVPIEVVYVAVAATGGISRYLQKYLDGSKFTWQHLVAHGFISMFSGYMFGQAATYLNLGEQASFIFVGMGGFMGVRALEMLETFGRNKFFGESKK
jgi:hypothetical protein